MIANTIITAALRDLLVVEGSKSPTAAQLSQGLEVLNDLVNSWSAQNDLVYEDTMEELAIPAGTQSITIGATGTLVTARPLRLSVATLKSGSTEYSMRLIDEIQYNNFSNKSSVGLPSRIYYRNTWPNGTIYFEYTTDIPYTLTLTSIKQLSTFPDGTTDVSLPDHYQRALKKNLAIEIAPSMGAGNRITPIMMQQAEESRTAVIGQAVDVVPSRTELRDRLNYNISADSY